MIPHKYVAVGSLLTKLARQHKVPRRDYLVTGSLRVIDQGAEFVGGWVDDLNLAYDGPLPVVVFGDHTRCVKFVDRAFAVGADGTQILLPTDAWDVRYFYYCLLATPVKNYGYERHFKYLKELKLPIRPLEIQRKIAAILSAYDDLIDNNKSRISALEEMAQRIYREWFVDFHFPGHEKVPLVDSEVGPTPQGWTPQTLAASCSLIQAGGTPLRQNPDYWTDGTVNWFKTTELKDGFLLGSAERVTELAVTERKTRMFPSGTILMAIYGSPTVGRLGVLTDESACNQAALAMAGRAVPQVVLYYMLVELRAHFNSIAQGAAQQNISKQKVEETMVACPPPALSRAAEEVIAPIWEQRRTLQLETARLADARDLLLPLLISGGIDVTDLNIAMPEATA